MEKLITMIVRPSWACRSEGVGHHYVGTLVDADINRAWTCPHKHATMDNAVECAREELSRRVAVSS